MKSVLEFLAELERNNNRDWFNANKAKYEAANKEVIAITSRALENIVAFDPALAGLVPKDCMFRIYRDVRFSGNKAPYKNNMGAWMAAGGKKSPSAGYYMHFQPGHSFVAAGVWMPEAPVLNAIRQEIHFNHAVFNKLLQGKDFKKKFPKLDDDQLKTVPKGFEKDHPAIDLLKYKSFVVSLPMDDKTVKGKDLMPFVADAFKSAAPFVKLINEAIEMSKPL